MSDIEIRELRFLMKKHNITRKQLGDKIGVVKNSVDRWFSSGYIPPEKYKKLISILEKEDISILAKVTMEQLVGEIFRRGFKVIVSKET